MNASRHEKHRVDAPALTKVGVAFAGLLILVFLLMGVLWQRIVPRYPNVPPQQVPAQPRLQAVPRADRIGYERAQRQSLDNYGWVDRGSGIAHIPIERAIDLLAARHAAGAQPGTKR